MLAHLKHRVLWVALVAVGVTLSACATEPNDSGGDHAAPERKLMPVKARPDMKATTQFRARGAQKQRPH